MKSKSCIPLIPLMLMAAACSSAGEPPSDHHDEEVSVIITALTDMSQEVAAGIQTRAEEISPTRYIIQYNGSDGVAYQTTSSDGRFNIKLKYGEDYTCLFWADNGVGYDISDLSAVSISGQPDMAAYCGHTEIQAGVSGQETISVTLSHAVGRIDLIQKTDFATTPGMLTMKADKTCSLDVSTGATSMATADVTYRFSGIKQNSAGECIATAYFIAPADEASLTTMTFTMEGEDTENPVSNVPLRRNHITKVTGNFSDLYNSAIDVSIDNDWKSSYHVELWDGVSTSVPKDYANGETTFYITNPRELAWLAQESSKDGMTFEGYTVFIDRDIHLNNMEWTPIGLNPQGFKGRIIGQGYRINELKITSGRHRNIGLFAYATNGCKISQLDVYGEITLDSPAEETNIGGLVGSMADSDLFSIHSYVKIYVADGQSGNVGGIIGSARDCDLFSIYTYSDISVSGSRMNVGGIVGAYTAKDFTTSGGSILNANYHESGTVSVSGGQYNNVGGIIGFFRGDNINEVGINACYNKAPVAVNDSRGSICGGLIGSCNGYSASKLEIWGCENSTPPIVSQSSDSFFGEIAGQAQVSGGYTLKLTQPRIMETVVIGKCYISDENSQIIYNSNPFTGGNGSSIYK